ncbi:unnamed protein product [Fusarium venenatum]|uniref:Uncharacterized protein n=1 Tax=Fusarium venenatum TaxID=56646 RepID=A0A2L2TZJ5_9HYPO|nr:uncharacterized protein FVRRES_10713 [Fusarium venenatum]CEI70636.1 unnamed protein product [Fusarium venenatum]
MAEIVGSVAVLDKLKVQLSKTKTTLEALEIFTQKVINETPTTRRVKLLLQESQTPKLQSDLKATRTQIMQLWLLLVWSVCYEMFNFCSTVKMLPLQTRFKPYNVWIRDATVINVSAINLQSPVGQFFS